MANQNETAKSKLFCPYCGSKDIIFRGKYLSIRNRNRTDKETSPDYIKTLKEKYTPLYESLIDENGKYPSAKQFDQWYSYQRKKCNSCGRSFIYDSSYPKNPHTHIEKASSKLSAIFQTRFISRHDFLEMFKDRNEQKFDPVFSFQNHIRKEALIAAYDKYILDIFSSKGSYPYGGSKSFSSGKYHSFVFSVKSQRLNKIVKVVLFVDRATLKIPKFVFYHEIDEFTKFINLSKMQISFNLPLYFRKKSGLKIKSTPDKKFEQRATQFLKSKGFHRALKYGSTIEENRQIVRYFLYRYNVSYTKNVKMDF